MAILILAAFILAPLLEIAVYIEVGGALGVGPTILLTVATAIAGTFLLRAQGLATLRRAQAQMDEGIVPAEELFNGLCIVLAGALLLVPGFVTDAVGLLLFAPPMRRMLRIALGRWVASRQGARVDVHAFRTGGGSPRRDRNDVVDAEYRDVTEEEEEEDRAQNGDDSSNSERRLPR